METKPGVDADEAIDALIEARARELEEANRVEASWAETTRRYNLRAQAERRQEWIAYHQDLQRLHRQLAEEHHRAALQLIDEGASAS